MDVSDDRHRGWAPDQEHGRHPGTANRSCDILCTSLTPDKTGQEACHFARVAGRWSPRWIIIDAPEDAALDAGLHALKGFKVVLKLQLITSWYGDRVAKRRVVVVLALKDFDRLATCFLERVQSREHAAPEALSAILLPTDGIEERLWKVPKDVKFDPRAHPHTDRFLPHAVGTWRNEAGEKHFVYATTGPTPNMRAFPTDDLGHGNGIYADTRDPHKLYRTLADFEVWRAHGHSATLWREHCATDRTVDHIMAGCAQALPMETARAMVAAVHDWAASTRAGVGYDRDEEEARCLMREWMRIWRLNPSSPGSDYRDWLESRRTTRAGASDDEDAGSPGDRVDGEAADDACRPTPTNTLAVDACFEATPTIDRTAPLVQFLDQLHIGERFGSASGPDTPFANMLPLNHQSSADQSPSGPFPSTPASSSTDDYARISAAACEARYSQRCMCAAGRRRTGDTCANPATPGTNRCEECRWSYRC